MRCGFDYCIYNKNFACRLDKIEINTLGQCDECIIVSLPEDKLKELKKEKLQKIMERYDAE